MDSSQNNFSSLELSGLVQPYNSSSAVSSQSPLIPKPLIDKALITSAARSSAMLQANSQNFINISKTLRDLIPDYRGLELEIQNYYKNCLNRAKIFEDSVTEALVIRERMSAQFKSLISNIESLIDQIDDYMETSYQQKFNPKKFELKFKKIDRNFEKLQKLQLKLAQHGESLNSASGEESDQTSHLGREISEQKLKEYLQIQSCEIESNKYLNDCKEKLKEAMREVKHKEDSREAAITKTKKHEEKLVRLKELERELGEKIVKETNDLTTYEEQRNNLRAQYHASYEQAVVFYAQKMMEVKKSYETQFEDLDALSKDLAHKLVSLSNTLKIKAPLETVRSQMANLEKKAKDRIEFARKIRNEELKDIETKDQELLDKKLKAVKEKEKEHEERISFLKAEKEECQKEIKDLEWELEGKRLCQSYNEEDIEVAKQLVEQLKVEYDQATKEKKLLTDDRINNLQLIMDNAKQRNFQTLQENFDFNKANSEFRTALEIQEMTLLKLKTFIDFFVQAGSFLRYDFDQVDHKVYTLTDDRVLDIVFNNYKDQIKLEPKEDIPNMMKIACKVLKIKSEDTTVTRVLDQLFSCLHPRALVVFSQSNEDQKSLIKSKLNIMCIDKKQSKETEHETLEEDKEKLQDKLNATQSDEKNLKTSLAEIEEDIEKKENSINELKKGRGKRSSKSDEDKENINDTNCSSKDEEDDSTDLSISKAEKDLRLLQEKATKAKEGLFELKNKRKYLDGKIDDLDAQMRKIKAEIKKAERSTNQIIEKVIMYYESLRSELGPGIQKYVHDIRNQNLETMKNSLKRSIYEPLKDYLKGINNPKILDQKEDIKSVIALEW